MKYLITLISILTSLSMAGTYTENFDDSNDWSGGAVGSYNAKNYYDDSNDPYTTGFYGSSVDRDTAEVHSSPYSFKFKNKKNTYFDYTIDREVTGFSVWLARWKSDNKKYFTIEYSTDSGSDFTEITTEKGTWFTGNKIFKQYSYSGTLTPDTGETLIIRVRLRVRKNMSLDDFEVDFAAPENPTALSGATDSSTQIDLSWSKNGDGDDVMIARNTTSSFGNPVDKTSYAVNDSLGSATVIYNGSGAAFSDTGLLANQAYYYKAWSAKSGNIDPEYSDGTSVISDTTDNVAAPSSLSYSDLGENSFFVNWAAVDGATYYSLDIATNNLFNTPLIVDNQNVGDVVTIEVSGLMPNSEYYARLRANCANGASPNSVVLGPITTLPEPTMGIFTLLLGSLIFSKRKF